MNYAEAPGAYMSTHHSQQQSQPRRHHNHHHHQQQQHATTPRNQAGEPAGTIRQQQTPCSAQHYRGSVASVSRQERFRRQQAEYFPGIGLDYVNNDPEEEHTQTRTPSPLVLDPSQPTPIPSNQIQPPIPKQGVVSRLVRGMGVSRDAAGTQPQQHNTIGSPSRQRKHTPSNPSRYNNDNHYYYDYQQQPQSQQYPSSPHLPTATDFARRAPRAGFLQKLGVNIPEFKRRFFILQPTTQLYYFVSPHDNTPRGSIPINDARVEMLEELQDGRCRIQLTWPSLDGQHQHHEQQQYPHRIVLEAKNKEVAQKWCQSLQQERLSYVKEELEKSQQQYAQAQYEMEELKQQIENYRFVEQDRDGALEDARRWKEQFEQLDEAVRLLANHVRKMPSTSTATTGCSSKQERGYEEENDDTGSQKGGDDENELVINESAKANRDGGEKAATVETNEDGARVEPGGEERTGESDTNKKDQFGQRNDVDRNTKRKHTISSLKAEDEEKEVEEVYAEDDNDNDSTDHDKNDTNISRRDISLLDDDAAAEEAAAGIFESKNIMEELDAPGQHFPSLVNACQQLRENLRLATEEASTAVEDTNSAQALAKALQSRMTKAEQQLCQLWEENCSIRKTLKQKKREKRVLVREVKSLLEQQQQQQAFVEQQRTAKGKGKSPTRASAEDGASTVMGSDEEKLINELEEHVVSSIRMHEEFLMAATGDTKSGKQRTAKEKLGLSSGVADVKGVPSSSSTAATAASSTQSGFGNAASQQLSSNDSANTTLIIENRHHQEAPYKHKVPMASLFDSNSTESDSEAEDQDVGGYETDKEEHSETAELPPVHKAPEHEHDTRSISSVAASFGGDSNDTPGRSRSSTPLRPNPLLQLDKDVEEEQRRSDEETLRPHAFKPISLAQRGSATSRLVCPLADVVETKHKATGHLNNVAGSSRSAHQEDLQIYHLTFYTRRIGLQFQKVPAPPTKARGLLTDAMTADLNGVPHGSCKTTTELKRVAAISTFAKPSSKDDDADSFLQVATPVDAVLVCGFEGFDDSGNNVRPKLGARLVAFDGVSVEIGKWTFESIRKAIQARGRPLTLSFRNDFLTTDQRAVMTRAVGDMQKLQPKETPVQQIRQPEGYIYPHSNEHGHDEIRPQSAVPSLQSTVSHETDHFVNEANNESANAFVDISKRDEQHQMDDIEDDLTVSTTGYSDHHHHSHYYHHHVQPQRRRFTASSAGSYSQGSHSYGNSKRRSSYNFQSFSDTGSSASALSSAVGPLLSNLMSGLSAEKRQRDDYTPDYLHKRQSVEDVPQHQDFKSNLL